MKLKILKEVKVAVISVVCIGVLIWGINFLKGKDFFVHKRTFYAVYDCVNGLVNTNPVSIKGVNVGQVTDIYFYPDGSNRVIVTFTINNDILISKNSVAEIFSSDLMGSKAIDIKLGVAKNSFDYAKNKDTLATSIQGSLQEEVNVQMLPLKKKAEDLMLSIDSVMAVVQYMFNENTRDNLRKSFESIKITVRNLEHTSYGIDTLVINQKKRLANILSNIESISQNIRKSNKDITNIIGNFSSVSDSVVKSDIVKTINNANKALKDISSIVEKVNKGESSLGKLVNNDTLYNQLKSSADNLDKLLEDMRLNPNRYVHFSVFGRKANKNKYTPSKKE